MTLLHRPFIAVVTTTRHEVELKKGSRPAPGSPFPLDDVERVRLGFVIENTGTTAAQKLQTEFDWTQQGAGWKTPRGGTSEIVPKQQRTVVADVDGDAIRKAIGGTVLKAVFKVTFSNTFGDPFETTHYIMVIPEAAGGNVTSLTVWDLDKETWAAR